MANSGIVVVVSGKDDTEAVFKQIESALGQVSNRARETEGALAGLGEKAKRAIEYIALYEGIRRAASAMKEAVVGSLELGETLEKTSKKTGLTVGTLSTLHYAAAVTSSDFSGMSSAIAKLDKSIGDAADGNKTADSFIRALGLDAKQLASRSDGAEVAFKKFAQAIAATENPIERVRLATGLLGRAGAQQIDTLVKIGSSWEYYRQKAQEAGVQLDGQTTESLAQANAQLKDMQQRLQGASLAFTEGLIPGINAMLDVIENNKGNMDAFVDFGGAVARSFAFATASVYAFLSGMKVAEAIGAKASPFASHADVVEAEKGADEYDDKATKALFFATHGYEKGWSESVAGHRALVSGGGKGFRGTGDIAGVQKLEAAQKSFAEARAALGRALDKEQGEQEKAAVDARLAALEDQHKRTLISDEDFYKKRADLQQRAIDAQKAALGRQKIDLIEQIGALNGKHLSGADAVERDTKVEGIKSKIVELDGQSARLTAEQAKNVAALSSALDEAADKKQALSDKLAAKREALGGASVDARLKQSRDAYSRKHDDLVVTFGAGSQEVANADAAQASAEGTIRAQGADTRYGTESAQIAAQRAAIRNAARSGAITTATEQQQLIELDKEQAAALQPVLAAYEKLAQTGDIAATNKVIELQQKISELEHPINEVAAHGRQQFDSIFESMFENLDRGKRGWQQLNQQIQHILLADAYKAFVEPLVQQAAGQIFPNGRPGAPGSPVASVGGIGKVLGGLIPHVAGLPAIGKISGNAGNIAVQIINQGTPMESAGSSQQTTSDESGFQERVISVILKDAESNGAGIQAILGAMNV